MPQEGKILQKPMQCECGRRGDFKHVSKKMFDIRWLNVIEPFEITTGEQPGEIMVFLKEDLTTPRMQKMTDPGSRLRIYGTLKELPKRIKGRLSTRMDMYVEANHVEPAEIEYEDIEITDKDRDKIIQLASDPQIYEKLKASIAPAIYGFDEIKESLVLQLVGGVVHRLPDGTRIRGNIHILITGDPGVGKSVVGSTAILHNAIDRPAYENIATLVDRQLARQHVPYQGAEVCFDNSEGVQVVSLDPQTGALEWKPVTAFIRHASPPTLLKITTRSGRVIVGTKDHGFVTMNSNGDIVPIAGAALSQKYVLPVPLGTHRCFQTSVIIDQHLRTNAVPLKKEIALDWGFGFFLGMFISEGSLSGGTVFIESMNDERKQEVASFLKGIGLHPNVGKKRVFVSSRALRAFLEKTCYAGTKTGKGKGSGAARKALPNFCFFAPHIFVEGLLSGLFSGDGYFVNARPGKDRTKGNLKLGFTTISPDLAAALLDILALVGVFATTRKKQYTYKERKGTAYEILVLGQHAKKLSKTIRMIGKQPVLTRFSEKDAFDVLPCCSLLYDIVRGLGYSRRSATNSQQRRAFAAMMRTVRNRNKVGRRRLEKIYQQMLHESATPRTREKIEKLRRILDANVVWDQIKTVEEAPSTERYVYDLSVDGNETFAANNLIVHNSQLLKLVSTVVPRGRYVSGKGVTGAGLTATVRKDEILGSWLLEAGALILANKGLISIDEFDKMNRDDQIAMHEAMSMETVSIAKASIVATLPAETAVLAGANPKHGRFDPFLSVAEQIQIPETLLSRFDLKFALKDKPDRGQDERLAAHIIMSREKPELVEPVIPIRLLKKYLAYVRQIRDIEVAEEASSLMKDFYVDMRNRYSSDEVPTVSITLRQYEALIRLAEASAKIRLDTKVRLEDAERAINLMKYSLSQLGMDYETGRIDIDKIESGVTASKRRKIGIVLDIINELQKSGEVAVEDVRAAAEDQGVENVDDILDRLKREGTIFEPKAGFLRKV